jgi:benzylsuccinate CoA-transferase BbsF subunit
VVIACFTDSQWDGIVDILGKPTWDHAEQLCRKEQRLLSQDELDRWLAEWCSEQAAADVFALFQAHGIPCGIVKSPEEMHRDPQLAHRHHYRKLEHPVMGLRTYDSPSFRLSSTPANLTHSPLLGQDNEYVFRELLGVSEEQLVDLILEGVLD